MVSGVLISFWPRPKNPKFVDLLCGKRVLCEMGTAVVAQMQSGPLVSVQSVFG